MKRLLFPAILLLAIGCTDKDSGGQASESISLSFELDTVMVDAGSFTYLRILMMTLALWSYPSMHHN